MQARIELGTTCFRSRPRRSRAARCNAASNRSRRSVMCQSQMPSLLPVTARLKRSSLRSAQLERLALLEHAPRQHDAQRDQDRRPAPRWRSAAAAWSCASPRPGTPRTRPSSGVSSRVDRVDPLEVRHTGTRGWPARRRCAHAAPRRPLEARRSRSPWPRSRSRGPCS